MNKKFFFLFLFISLGLISCQEDQLYSCDPDVESWVNNNMLKISKMSRVDFLSLENDSYKRAAYRTFSVEKQRSLWIDKYEELKRLDWTEAEMKHIDLIYSVVLNEEKSIFKISDLENNDEIMKFIYRWEEYGREKLGWNKKQIYAICYTPEIIDNTQGDLALFYIQRINDKLSKDGWSDCSCSDRSNFCDPFDHEGPPYTYCRTPTGGGCNETLDGCGLFWRYPCVGMCLGLYV